MLNNEVWETLLEYDAILMPWRSASRRAHSRLHRRKRTEPTAASLPHLGAARANAGFAIQLQLEEPVGGRRADSVELLLSPVSRCREEGASAGLSASLGSTLASAAAGGVGPFAGGTAVD